MFKLGREYVEIEHDEFKYMLKSEYSFETHIHGYETRMPFIHLSEQGLLTLKVFYSCDGASGPTIDCRHNMRAAFVHDALYQLISLMVLTPRHRKSADKIFYKILREDGMNWIRAKYYYWAVRAFGGKHCE